MAHTVWIALGSNQGDAKALFRAVQEKLGDVLTDIAWSECYRTAPMDCTGGDYINAVVRGVTTLDAPTLMSSLLAIEKVLGRVRPSVAPLTATYAARTVDLDILMWTGPTMDLPDVTIPHPRMRNRLFVLEPLRDVLPEKRLMTGENVDDLIAKIRQEDPAQRVECVANFMA